MERAIDLGRIRRSLGIGDTPGKPGLIVGKGPSYARIASIDPCDYLTVGLNHVVSLQRVDVASAVDLEVVAECADAIDANARVLAIPYHPHVGFTPTEATVFDHFDRYGVLCKLHEQDRLLVYNASTARKLPRLAGAPDLQLRFFSSEAGYEILALLGVDRIYTAGVDGGELYDEAFDGRTRLANGRENFNVQFLSLHDKFRRTGIPYGPLGSEAPIRVFVGCDETQHLASRVLEFTLCMNGDTAVDLQRIDNAGLPVPVNPEKRARTPFSFARLKIPMLCGYRGRAIYLDADMIVFANVRELWEADFRGHELLYSEWGGDRRPQYSVMVMDCGRLHWKAEELVASLDRPEVGYEDVMYDFAFMDRSRLGALVPETWNSLEHFEPGQTRLLHYTDMHRQPWVSDENENGPLFYELLRSALETGFIERREFEAEVVRGHVAPRLPDWIGRTRPRGTPSEQRWVPPFKKTRKRKRSLFRRLRDWL